jgi:dihydrofolate reductase
MVPPDWRFDWRSFRLSIWPETMFRPFNLIAACSENRVIGRAGRLPWRIPEDFLFFQQQTAGQIVIMGRVCHETWTAAAGDGRRPIVLTRNLARAQPGVRVADSLAAALAVADTLPGEIYVCGGQRAFEEAIIRPEAARLYLTLIHAEVEGDRHFPDWRPAFTRVVSRREGADATWRYTFLTLER